MKKYKAGGFFFNKENCFEYYTDDFKTFYQENDKELTSEDLEEWALTLNSPWSQADEKYEIAVNCKNAYTPMDESEPIWRCKYYTIGYECISAYVFGYGNTEAEALEDCKNHFNMLQNKYNPEDESF